MADILNPQETISYGLPADFNLSIRIARRSVWDGFFCAIANYFLNNSYICYTNYHWGTKKSIWL